MNLAHPSTQWHMRRITLASCLLLCSIPRACAFGGRLGNVRDAGYAVFDSPGRYGESAATLTVNVPGGNAYEGGELVINHPFAAVAGERFPVVFFMFPVHGFPFTVWRTLLAPVIRSLTSHGFAVATPNVIGAESRRVITGGIFPGAQTTVSGIDLREIATRYVNFMTHAVRYVDDLASRDRATVDFIDPRRVGLMGYSVGGALAHYVALRLEHALPRKVACVIAFAPTIGSDDPFDPSSDDIGAELFRELIDAPPAGVPTIYVAGEKDGMGGLRDSGVYFSHIRAPRVRVIAGEDATHCHAIAPMSECDVVAGTRGLQRLDSIVALTALTLYARPPTDDPTRRELAKRILWYDEGLRALQSQISPATPASRRWSVRRVERQAEISLRADAYSIVAPLAPRETTFSVSARASTHADDCVVSDLRVESPVELGAAVERVGDGDFVVGVSWMTVPTRNRPSNSLGSSALRRLFNSVWTRVASASSGSRDAGDDEDEDVPRVESEFGARATSPARSSIAIEASSACERTGYASASVFVNQPY